MYFINQKNFVIEGLSEEKFKHAINVVKNNDDEKYHECDIIGSISYYNICLDIILQQYDDGYALEFNVFDFGKEGYGITELGIPYDIINGQGDIIFDINNVNEYENMTYENFILKLGYKLFETIIRIYLK